MKRDFTHVSDICVGLHAALTVEDAVGKAINLGHDQPITMRELIEILEEELGIDAKIDFRPQRREDLPITHADLSLAKRILGYEPTVPIREGVREYVDWFRESTLVRRKVS